MKRNSTLWAFLLAMPLAIGACTDADLQALLSDLGLTIDVNVNVNSDVAGDDTAIDIKIEDPASTPTVSRTIPTGDWSRNGRLDLADVQGLQQCISESATDGGCACRIFDFNVDGVVTLEDVGAFVGGLVGP